MLPSFLAKLQASRTEIPKTKNQRTKEMERRPINICLRNVAKFAAWLKHLTIPGPASFRRSFGRFNLQEAPLAVHVPMQVVVNALKGVVLQWKNPIYTRWDGDYIEIMLSNCLMDFMHSWDSTGARISGCTSTVKLEGLWRVFRRCRILSRAQENNTESKTLSFMGMSFSCGDIVLPCFTLTCGKQWLQLSPQYSPKPYLLPSLVFLQGQQTINYTLSTNLLEHAYITCPCLYHISLQHVTSNT